VALKLGRRTQNRERERASERESEREREGGGSERHYISGGDGNIIFCLKVPMQAR
jgi:hypothetical protein